MSDEFDVMGLAHELAEIARTTRDPQTGRRLMSIVERLLTQAGLPSDDHVGGGQPPNPWMYEAACHSADT